MLHDKLHTTNCFNTFIRVAEDCPARTGEEPPLRAGSRTLAGLQYRMIAQAPYKYTSDDVVFATSAPGRQLDAKATRKQRDLARSEFFSRGQACLRASGLGKRFGWGIHADAEGRVALRRRRQAYRRARDPDLPDARSAEAGVKRECLPGAPSRAFQQQLLVTSSENLFDSAISTRPGHRDRRRARHAVIESRKSGAALRAAS
jgi:hypothetical protein